MVPLRCDLWQQVFDCQTHSLPPPRCRCHTSFQVHFVRGRRSTRIMSKRSRESLAKRGDCCRKRHLCLSHQAAQWQTAGNQHPRPIIISPQNAHIWPRSDQWQDTRVERLRKQQRVTVIALKYHKKGRKRLRSHKRLRSAEENVNLFKVGRSGVEGHGSGSQENQKGSNSKKSRSDKKATTVV